MAERLIPCAGCSRHVKASEAACPFCGTSMLAVSAPVAEPFRRMAAAAAVAAGVVALTGCSSSSSGSPSGDDAAVLEDASIVVFYGAPNIIDATPPAVDASDDGPSAVAIYGAPAPPVDSGAAPDSGPDASDSG